VRAVEVARVELLDVVVARIELRVVVVASVEMRVVGLTFALVLRTRAFVVDDAGTAGVMAGDDGVRERGNDFRRLPLLGLRCRLWIGPRSRV
jgi:hypothetical protein